MLLFLASRHSSRTQHGQGESEERGGVCFRNDNSTGEAQRTRVRIPYRKPAVVVLDRYSVDTGSVRQLAAEHETREVTESIAASAGGLEAEVRTRQVDHTVVE